ncbi:cation:dicarboxylate symporter family transporter, partial [Enterocloster lavalensis]
MDKKSIWKSYRFPIILVIGIVVGALLGVTLGEKATVLKPLGDIFLNLMFTIVVPMVFVSITTAVGNMVNMKRLGKILGNLVLTFIVTGLFAAALVLTVVNIWPPAANTSI